MVSVTITQGTLKGGKAKTEKGFEYFEFLGIPYAKPPVGDLRFKSPQPPEPWMGEKDATHFDSSNCSCQKDMFTNKLAGSEDCLYLNVYSPKLPSSGSNPLPVMVYIHGGGFIHGSGTIKSDNGPDYLLEHNVVVVSINYRLGIFGFLSLDIPEAAGNMGLKDQVKALEWIQENINTFGGDKNNVTLFGISAGSAAIEYLILSPLAKGLFHKAILQSGSTLNQWAINFKPKEIILHLVEKLGYNGSTEDNRALYQFLYNSQAEILIELFSKVQENYPTKPLIFGFVPVVEKDFGNRDAFLTESPYKLLKEGKFNPIPVIRGFCDKEGYLGKMFKPNFVPDIIENNNFVDYWTYNFDGDEGVMYNKKFLSAYAKNKKPDDEQDMIAIDFFGDLNFSAGVWIAGKMSVKKGVPVYFYQFSYDGGINIAKKYSGIKGRGASHSDDMCYILRVDKAPTANETDSLVRCRMTKMWTDFAKLGNPTPATSDQIPVKWPIFIENSSVYLQIDKELKIDSSYKPEQIALFEEIYDKYGQ